MSLTDSNPAPAGVSAEPPRQPRWARRIVVACLALAVVTTAGAGTTWRWLDRWSRAPFGEAAVHALTIEPGAGARRIAHQLQDEGLLSRDWALLAWLRLHDRARALQAGRYEIRTPIAPAELVAALGHGAFERTLTIPEGWTARQIARRLVSEQWIADQGEWLDLVARPLGPDVLGIPISEGAEGFCFPETYRFDEGTSAPLILARMLEEWRRRWAAARPEERDARSRDLTTREVVILAAMIEREARSPDEMPAIAAVYLNRLQKGMKLQCCATVRYALGEVWDRALTLADLKVESAYNSYEHSGLPPGPIANPGRPSLEAVLRPAPGDFLFYVYNGEGRHIFSRTFAEHQRAVRATRDRHPEAALTAQGRD
jgi:UPF0755 protein